MFSLPYTVQKDITINKSIDEVFNFLIDFKNWNKWSPWICLETTAQTKIENSPAQLGHKQTWEGDLIGSGDMTLVEMTKNINVGISLRFYKPWKSQSITRFKLEKVGNSTKVIWTMDGNLPIFMFFMKKMMKAFIGFDFNRGLSMLKQYLETGVVLTKTDVKGEAKKEEFYIVGIETAAQIKDLASSMSRDFQKLHQYIESGLLPAPDSFLDFTHKYDMVTGECLYTAALAYKNKVTLPTGLQLKTDYIKSHQSYDLIHTGSYDNLGNTWTKAMMLQRKLKLKKNKSIDPYEIYLNNPMTTNTSDLKTQIIIPVR